MRVGLGDGVGILQTGLHHKLTDNEDLRLAHYASIAPARTIVSYRENAKRRYVQLGAEGGRDAGTELVTGFRPQQDTMHYLSSCCGLLCHAGDWLIPHSIGMYSP